MQYNQPKDQPSNPNAPYIDGNPAAGIQGSIVPAASIEYDQRETVEVITRANVRGYSDFSGVPCAVPANTDLSQLRKAIEGFITSWQFIIDTEVTFKVHGSGADFPDLIAAFEYLGKYRITPNGHVILQLAGAASGSAASQQYVYTQTIVAAHANNDRISIFGAPMLAPVSRNDTGYAWNGSSATQRAADTTTNLAILRTQFATELHWGGAPINGQQQWSAGLLILGKVLMHLDGILFTGYGSAAPAWCDGVLFWAAGPLNWQPRSLVTGSSPFAYDGLASVSFSGSGFNFDVGSCVELEGETGDQAYISPLIAIGNNTGILMGNGGFVTSSGNCVCLCNDYNGFHLYPRSGTQWDGGVFSNANGADGVYLYLSSTGFIAGPIINGAWAAAASHCYRNAGWGVECNMSNISCDIDFGAGVNANVAGAIYTYQNGGVNLWGSSANYTGKCSPAFGTVGNANSMIST
jgi:hypothetical protein